MWYIVITRSLLKDAMEEDVIQSQIVVHSIVGELDNKRSYRNSHCVQKEPAK